MKRIPEYFIKGLLFFVPLAVTVMFFKFVLVRVDNLLPLPVPGLGLVLSLALITGLGFLTQHWYTKYIAIFIDRLFRNVPFVSLVYNSLRDLIDAFVGKKKVFDRPVMVRPYNGSSAKALGFITTESLEHLNIHDHVAVYLPQSYNFAGQTLLFPKDQVTPIDGVHSSEFISFIVSAGLAGRKDSKS